MTSFFLKYSLHTSLLGAALCIVVPIWYFAQGYSKTLAFVWILGMILAAFGLFIRERKPTAQEKNFDWSDVLIAGIIGVVILPFYIAHIYYLPIQVSTDEQTIMFFEKTLVSQTSPDIFGLSNYFRYPSLVFLFFGWIGKFLGGLDLYHLRLAHALSGVAIVIGAYFLFRLLLPAFETQPKLQKIYAVMGALLVAFSHSFLMISRMAMYNTSTLLVEIPAFILLFIGIKRRSSFYALTGGFIVGLSIYNYLPGRIVALQWIFFLILLAIFFRKKYPVLAMMKQGTVMLAGFFFVVAPLLVASATSNNTELEDVKHKSLLFPEGRLEQQHWVGASSIAEGIKINLIQGLGAFNNNLYDHNYVYLNRGHGFVDPLTGILLWLGAIIFSMTAFQRKLRIEDLFMVLCFFSLWLALSIFFTKNPHYNRLITILPFSTYLVLRGMMTLGSLYEKFAGFVKRIPSAIANQAVASGIIVTTIIGWNLIIAGDFIRTGFTAGDAVGGTARYIESRKGISPYTFYVAANKGVYPYYYWGEAWQWEQWSGFFGGPSQGAKVIEPGNLFSFDAAPPFTIFMNDRLWNETAAMLMKRYPTMRIYSITPPGDRIAIEVR